MYFLSASFFTESAVAAGIRRIEAITALKAEEFFDKREQEIHEIKTLLKNSKDIVKSIHHILEENDQLHKQVHHFVKEKAKTLKVELIAKKQLKNGVNFIAELIDLDNAEALKDMLFEIRDQVDNLVCVLGTEIKGKPSLSVIISDNLIKEKNLNAGNIIRELAKEIQGGGGGQAFYATAGGTHREGLKAAIEKAYIVMS